MFHCWDLHPWSYWRMEFSLPALRISNSSSLTRSSRLRWDSQISIKNYAVQCSNLFLQDILTSHVPQLKQFKKCVRWGFSHSQHKSNWINGHYMNVFLTPSESGQVVIYLSPPLVLTNVASTFTLWANPVISKYTNANDYQPMVHNTVSKTNRDSRAEVNISPKNLYFFTDPKNGPARESSQ